LPDQRLLRGRRSPSKPTALDWAGHFLDGPFSLRERNSDGHRFAYLRDCVSDPAEAPAVFLHALPVLGDEDGEYRPGAPDPGTDDGSGETRDREPAGLRGRQVSDDDRGDHRVDRKLEPQRLRDANG